MILAYVDRVLIRIAHTMLARESSVFLDSLTSPLTTRRHSPPPSPARSSPSPSTPTPTLCSTPVVSSTAHAKASPTMVSPPLDTELIPTPASTTTSSRTPGAHLGVLMDTSGSGETPVSRVDSVMLPETLPTHRLLPTEWMFKNQRDLIVK